jgi:spoIIIJ-associated protein
VIAPTVEEAVARGAAELGIPEDGLEVEILDEGGRMLFGLGARQARVRLTVRPSDPSAAQPEAVAEEIEGPPEDDETLRVARDTVTELLDRMGVSARVTAAWGEMSEGQEVRPLLVDVRGRDLSVLIGRRGETLGALQYITRLIVGKELHTPTAVVIDIEGYRSRRERQLRALARRMADQAVERQRTMTLEPMPANERRIVHIELRDHPDVTTESVGEGEKRKVTIIPKH